MNIDHYISIPLGSLVKHFEEEDYYLELFQKMPAGIKKLVTSPATGAFIRGLSKSHQLPIKKTYFLSFLILQVVGGEVKIAQIAGQISSKLSLPNDKAQRMAKEIEEDLLRPIRKELEEFWNQQKKEEPIKKAEEQATQGGANNILNLKKEQNPPLPPWRKENRN